MGSLKYTGFDGPKTLVTFLKALLCSSNVMLLLGAVTVQLLTGFQVTHAQSGTFQNRNGVSLPQDHLMPLGGLGDSLGELRANSSASFPKRRKIPTLRARYRPQDGDLFGEGQANDSAGDSIFDQLEKGPQPPATKRPTQSNPFGEPKQKNAFGEPKQRNVFGEPKQRNVFGEPKTRTPLDPSPREPLMDTKREQPNQRPERRTPRQSGRNGTPQLPDDGQYTPDRVPEMPMPDGGTRSTDKAGTMPREKGSSRDLTEPEEEDIEDDFNAFQEDLEGFDLVDPGDRSPRSSRRRRSTDRNTQDRPRSRASNVYRPAREPSYYSKPTDTYGQYPQGYDPNNAYASQPSGAASEMQIIVQNAVQQAMRNYAANPANPAVAPYYGRGYACPPCPPSLQRPPSPELVAAYCGCVPQQGAQTFPTDPAVMLSQQFAQPSSSSYSPAVANEVYEGVVSGDKEIEAFDPRRFPQKKPLLGIGAIRNNGPNIYYGSIFGGWTGLDDLMLSGDEGNLQISNEDGFNVGFALGQIQGKNLRSELEVTYRSNDLTGMTLNDLAGASQSFEGDGNIESISGMLNVIWDFTDLPTQRIKPYLGGGIGGVSADADFQIDGMRTLGDGNDTSLAYQWIAGINFQTRRFSDIFVEYRYFAADSLHFNTTLPASAIIDGDGELEYRTSNVLFGIRMKF